MHHAETATIVAKSSKIDLAAIERMPRSSLATSMDPGQYQPVLTSMYEFGAEVFCQPEVSRG